ncbi:PfkB family carbohydrate kinase [Propioniciclava soli]|uniref:PfkB family carbohydrate kinase n=1 Tax=Propioniciclava soli TaxID=2775081 RepID=UPI001E60B811
MPRIIHTGQALVDAVARVPALPARGQNVMASSWELAAAGSVNILVAAARSGATCVQAGVVGTGRNGDLVRAALAAEGITWSAEAIPDADTGLCLVLVEPDGERTFVTTLGAERRLSVAALDRSAPRPGDLVCVTGYSLAVEATRAPLEAWLADLPAGVAVVLDPGAVFAGLSDATRAAMLGRTTVWTSNLAEAEAILAGTETETGTGTGARGMAATAAAVSRLLAPGGVAIVRDGPAGCAVHAGGQTTLVPGFPQEAVDTNGAGDAHTGVLLAELARGTGWVVACRRANVGGAIKVTRSGPATAPTGAEIDAFWAAWPRP